ncbi:MAG: ANTAR domain-containing protein [Ruminococcus sp.]|nr:ANTAR domain-containing protein [Ruminococcus sp.]MDE6848462.1 ANTAR domain-containing protein [Ruminococcus sp.]MDE7138887.1 ANTAR domain-containing protein [Ruminococcus sp.]
MNILIVSQYDENINTIEQLVKTETGGKTVIVSSGSEARRIISDDTEPKLVIINTPLPDEFGQELSVMISETTDAGVILICRNDIAEDISHSVADSGIVVVSRPLSNEIFKEAIRKTDRSEIHGIKRENVGILTRIDEMRLINRAKCTLMEYLKFTEPQAHRYIEKQAMNNRQTRREVADKILNTYKK